MMKSNDVVLTHASFSNIFSSATDFARGGCAKDAGGEVPNSAKEADASLYEVESKMKSSLST